MAIAKTVNRFSSNETLQGRVLNRRPIEVLPRPELTTERLVFRLLSPGDEQGFIDALEHSRSEVRRWMPVNRDDESDSHFFQRTMTRARIQDIEGNAWRRAAYIQHGPDAGQFVGLFNLIKIQRGLEWNCEANWWVDSRLTGQGYGTEGLNGIMDFAMREHPTGLGMHRVRCYICADNPASVRIATRYGFVQTASRELVEINRALVHHDEFEFVAG